MEMGLRFLEIANPCSFRNSDCSDANKPNISVSLITFHSEPTTLANRGEDFVSLNLGHRRRTAGVSGCVDPPSGSHLVFREFKKDIRNQHYTPHLGGVRQHAKDGGECEGCVPLAQHVCTKSTSGHASGLPEISWPSVC